MRIKPSLSPQRVNDAPVGDGSQPGAERASRVVRVAHRVDGQQNILNRTARLQVSFGEETPVAGNISVKVVSLPGRL